MCSLYSIPINRFITKIIYILYRIKIIYKTRRHVTHYIKTAEIVILLYKTSFKQSNNLMKKETS